MKRRNRSPGLGTLALIATLMIGLPISASEIERTNVPDRGLPDQSDPAMEGPTADATVMSERSAAVSCHKGKRVIGTSSSYVLRAAIKSAGSNCYTCCADKIFFDDFESSDTSRWSAVVGN